MIYTLEYNGDRRPLADWGISGMQRTVSSQAADTITFSIAVRDAADDPEIPNGAQIIIRRDDTGWFAGTVSKLASSGSGSSSALQYEAKGPWWLMEQLVYKTSWASIAGSPATPEQRLTGHILLYRAPSLGPITTGAQIAGIIDYAIAQGVSIQRGTIDPDAYVPIDEIIDTTCAEAIRRCLRWHPDCVTWCDYATTPPTFHCRKRANLPATTLATISAENKKDGRPKIAEWNITPRADLQVPSVAIHYEQTNEYDGSSYLRVINDIAPPTATGQEIGCLSATVDMQGSKTSLVKASIDTDTLPIGANFLFAKNWLLKKAPNIADAIASGRISDLTVKSVEAVNTDDGTPATLPYELLEGQIAPWMEFESREIEIKLKLAYKAQESVWVPASSGNERVAIIDDQMVSIKVMATDAPSGDYSTVSATEFADPIPVGLATKLYDSLKDLQHEGQIRLKERDCTGAASLGSVVNIEGGRPEWQTLRATIQSIRENLDAGTTEIAFGPANQLGLTDFIELLRANRVRKKWTLSTVQDDAKTGEGDIELGSATPKLSITTGTPEHSQFAVVGKQGIIRMNHDFGGGEIRLFQRPSYGSGQIIIGLQDAAGKEIKLRQISTCQTDAAGKKIIRKMIILASELYD